MIHIGNREHGEAIGKAAGVKYDPEMDAVVSREDGGELKGGVVYQGYTKHSIAMHVAGLRPNWINRDLLRTAFYFPFVQLGCVKVFGHVPESNTAAIELDLHLGFEKVTFIPDVFANGGMHILAMERTKCRWLLLPPPTEVMVNGVLIQKHDVPDRD